MSLIIDPFSTDLDSRFKIFHELMQWKVRDILLVSTPYDAWVLEEDCRLSERIISEYRGLNLSKPPRITWVRSADQALAALDSKRFDLVLSMSRLTDTTPDELARQIKSKAPDLPVILLSHVMVVPQELCIPPTASSAIDRAFVWSGDTDILVALVKSAEDRMNVARDTEAAGIRVILFVEDAPCYLSSLLPILYSEVVGQTQALMGGGLNEEHRLLTMRARPKILIGSNYDEALALFERFEPYVLGVIADVAIQRHNGRNSAAGPEFLDHVKHVRFDIPLLLTGSSPEHLRQAEERGAAFVDKHSSSLNAEVRSFFKTHLGFGDFIFRMRDGREIGRAHNLRTLAEGIARIPEESLVLHSRRNDFSRWLFARAEIVLASKLRPLTGEDFPDMASHRRYLVEIVQARRHRRLKGVVVNFDATDIDPQTEFFKIGKGSLGGKARGLAFLGSLLRHTPQLHQTFENVSICIPQSLVITTDGFEAFVEANGLGHLARTEMPDAAIAQQFLAARMPDHLQQALQAFLSFADFPLAVRSSSLLEDAQLHAYAGLYRTYMLPNNQPRLEQRLAHLLQAVKLVYASTYFQDPRAYAKRVGHRTEEEKMAVIIQQLVGAPQKDSYYPAVSGVAQSHNYYPLARMKPEDGIAVIALGLGKMVVAGESSLRFCPKYPKLPLQRGSVDEILAFAQRHFYALQMRGEVPLGLDDSATLVRREVSAAADEPFVQRLASTYMPEEHRIRDTVQIPGARVLTFASVLKYGIFPLAEILQQVLAMGQEGLGCAVEIEFSANLAASAKDPAQFVLLQIRPMTARAAAVQVNIRPEEIRQAVCYSQYAMGNEDQRRIRDIVYVKHENFDAARTRDIARQISDFNAVLTNEQRKYLLIGPGRWGSQDPWLGIPVQWSDISGVGAMVETVSAGLKAEPSQGSHFFHNLVALGISYLSVGDRAPDHMDWSWLAAQRPQAEKEHVVHVRLDRPLQIKVDGRTSRGLILPSFAERQPV